jgi:hypothetical protein
MESDVGEDKGQSDSENVTSRAENPGNVQNGSSIDDKGPRQKRHQLRATDGYVEVKMRSGSYYLGYLKNGKKEGPDGKFVWPNGDVYLGAWKDNKRHGKGTFTFASGAVYEGNYLMNKKCGRGTYRYANGNVYEGEWVDNKTHGKGTFSFANGDIFRGSVVNDLFHGDGEYCYANGDIFTGTYAENQRQGRGTYIRFVFSHPSCFSSRLVLVPALPPDDFFPLRFRSRFDSQGPTRMPMAIATKESTTETRAMEKECSLP